MFRIIRKFLVGVPAMALLWCGMTPVLHAQNAVTLETGLTRITLTPAFASELAGLGHMATPISPSHLHKGVLTFPIVGGVIDLDTALTQTIHTGGITLSSGTMTVQLESFIIDSTGSQPYVTAMVVENKKLLGRIPLFYLTPAAGFTLPLVPSDGVLRLNDAQLSLTGTAAATLNAAFNTSMLQDHQLAGTANVTAVILGGDPDDGDDHRD